MNLIWNKNYSAFKARFPQLSKMLPIPSNEDISKYTFWKIMPAKNNMITCSENGLRLHSVYNPEREAITGISNKEIEDKQTTVFYGFGLGYHVIQWVKKFISLDKSRNAKKLILIEPDYKHFFAAMCILDWTEVFKLENLILAINCPVESVLPLIEDTTKINIGNTGVSNTYFFTIPAFIAHEKSYFDTIQTIISRNKKKNDINTATLKRFGKLWCNNSLKNISKMKELSSVSSFYPSFNNISSLPFFVVGAGPSLEKILPYMAEIKKRTVVICVETALRALLRVKVQPDFIIITDPQFWAYKHIAGLSSPESILVTEISTYSAVFRFSCKKIILCNSQFPIGQYFQQKLNANLGDLGAGGSVASSAWNLAHLWGAKEIFTAGLDFAFPNNQTHIKGSDAEESYLATANRLSTLDNFTLSGLFNANAQTGISYNKQAVITDARMKMFSWWFEARLAKCPETKTYTLCPEGLNTPGITPAKIETLLKYKDISREKEKLLQLALNEPVIKGDKLPAFKKLIREFPSREFIEQFPFLEEYL